MARRAGRGARVDIVNSACNILSEQEGLFARYETATLALLDCAPEDASHYITERDRLANRIDELNEQLAKLCAETPNGELLMAAAKGRVPFEKVPSEYQPVFYAGQAVRSVGARIAETNKQVLERMERLRDEAGEYMKQNQNLPKIKRYLDGLTPPMDEVPRHESKA